MTSVQSACNKRGPRQIIGHQSHMVPRARPAGTFGFPKLTVRFDSRHPLHTRKPFNTGESGAISTIEMGQ